MNDQLIRSLAETASCLQRLSVQAVESQLPAAADFDNAMREVLDFIRVID